MWAAISGSAAVAASVGIHLPLSQNWSPLPNSAKMAKLWGKKAYALLSITVFEILDVSAALLNADYFCPFNSS